MPVNPFPRPAMPPLRGGPVLRWGIVTPVGGEQHLWHDTSGLVMRDDLARQTTALAQGTAGDTTVSIPQIS